MLTSINRYSYMDLQKLVSKRARFTSQCRLFPNFDVTGTIVKVWNRANIEIMIDLQVDNKPKPISIGCNMDKLKVDLLT